VTGVTNHPPTATISTPAGATLTTAKGSTVSFAGSVADSDGGDSATALWTFPDNWATSGATSFSHTFNRAGIFPVTLLATDTHGATAAATVSVKVTEAGDDCSAPLVIPGGGPFPGCSGDQRRNNRDARQCLYVHSWSRPERAGESRGDRDEYDADDCELGRSDGRRSL
jgi:PKD domain